LKNVTGYEGDVLGAEVVSVSPGSTNASEVIEIRVPVDPELADRITVITPAGKKVKLDKPMELSLDHENNQVGIILRLPKKNGLGFKIRLIDLPDE